MSTTLTKVASVAAIAFAAGVLVNGHSTPQWAGPVGTPIELGQPCQEDMPCCDFKFSS